MDKITEKAFIEIAERINLIIRNNSTISYADFSTYYSYFNFLWLCRKYHPEFNDTIKRIAQYLSRAKVETTGMLEKQTVANAQNEIINLNSETTNNLTKNSAISRHRVKPSDK